ncbi:MAG: transposase [Candidatus Parabeggiatoa sp.]|nr:transposase [Candidatus Parabeggiatoa sp.]
MQRVERHIIVDSDALNELTFKAKNLYNVANYQIRQTFIFTGLMPCEYELSTFLANINQPDYRALPAQTSQQVIKLLFKNWTSYFAVIREWKKNPSKFKGMPKIPRYKKKNGHFVAIFTNQQVKIKEGFIYFPKAVNISPLKTSVSKPKQVRIIPQATCFVVEIVYDKEVQKVETVPDSFLAIDLGLNNLATSFNNVGLTPFIVNGKPLKSINAWFNKNKAKLQSQLPKGIFSTRHINHLTHKRHQKINDYIHKTSRFIVDYCVENRIGTIIIGNNEGWKNRINIGKRNNQNFVQIPHTQLILSIEYKALEFGIWVKITEESYTSKTDNLVLEPLKKHGSNQIKKPSLGKRVKRGLFHSSNGMLINADCNGAIGIARKVVGDLALKPITDKSIALMPRHRFSF